MDDQLLKLAQKGCSDSWANIIDSHHADIYRYLLLLTRSKQDAEDLVQETFIRLYRSANLFRFQSSLRTYLHSIAYREFLSWKKKLKLSQFPLEDSAPDCDDPTKLIEIYDALSRLPEHHQTVIILVELQGFSIKEVSLTLKIPQGTVKSRLFHARATLKCALAIHPTMKPEPSMENKS